MKIFKPIDPQRHARVLRGLFGHFQVEIAFYANSPNQQKQFDSLFDLLFHGLVDTGRPEGNP